MDIFQISKNIYLASECSMTYKEGIDMTKSLSTLKILPIVATDTL